MACKKKCGGKVTKKQTGGPRFTGGVGPTTKDNATTKRDKKK